MASSERSGRGGAPSKGGSRQGGAQKPAKGSAAPKKPARPGPAKGGAGKGAAAPAKPAKKPEAARLAATLGGRPLSDEEARALWAEFSAHMDEHRGDMSGFATKKGFRSIRPEFRGGRAVLLVEP